MYEQGEQIETEQVNPWRIITLITLLALALQNFYFFPSTPDFESSRCPLAHTGL